jgi:hypothetical protein
MMIFMSCTFHPKKTIISSPCTYNIHHTPNLYKPPKKNSKLLELDTPRHIYIRSLFSAPTISRFIQYLKVQH